MWGRKGVLHKMTQIVINSSDSFCVFCQFFQSRGQIMKHYHSESSCFTSNLHYSKANGEVYPKYLESPVKIRSTYKFEKEAHNIKYSVISSYHK